MTTVIFIQQKATRTMGATGATVSVTDTLNQQGTTNDVQHPRV